MNLDNCICINVHVLVCGIGYIHKYLIIYTQIPLFKYNNIIIVKSKWRVVDVHEGFDEGLGFCLNIVYTCGMMRETERGCKRIKYINIGLFVKNRIIINPYSLICIPFSPVLLRFEKE